MKRLEHFDRFVEAQEACYARVLGELHAGRKQTHWMWFIFPQMIGLGQSPMSRRYALTSLEEAALYLRHPLLGPRLRECTDLVNAVHTLSVSAVFAAPDDSKFHSCMSLFALATHDREVFDCALRRFFGSAYDRATLRALGIADVLRISQEAAAPGRSGT